MGELRFDLTKALKWSLVLTGLYLVAEVAYAFHAYWSLTFFDRIESGNFSQADLIAEGKKIDALGAVVAIGAIAVLILACIANGIWTYRASWNARELQPDPSRITPGWAVGWHFIPIALLWKPFQAMRQTWNSSEDPTLDIDRSAPGLLAFWWTMWLISNFAGNASFRASLKAEDLDDFRRVAHFDLASFVFSVPAILLFMTVMRRVTEMQVARSQGPLP